MSNCFTHLLSNELACRVQEAPHARQRIDAKFMNRAKDLTPLHQKAVERGLSCVHICEKSANTFLNMDDQGLVGDSPALARALHSDLKLLA